MSSSSFLGRDEAMFRLRGLEDYPSDFGGWWCFKLTPLLINQNNPVVLQLTLPETPTKIFRFSRGDLPATRKLLNDDLFGPAKS